MRSTRISPFYYFSVLALGILGSGMLFNKIFNQKKNFQAVSPSIQNLLNLREDKIEVGVAALILAKEIYPDINVASYSGKIDALTEQVRRLANGTRNPDQRIRCLNTVILLYEKFQGTRDPSSAHKTENYYLNHVLDSKQGNCFSMPILYVAVAQRLKWPVYLVSLPDHCFVRYADAALTEPNIETTSNGGYVPDDKYAKDFMVSEAGRKNGAYLRALTYYETLGDLVAINGITYGQRGETAKAVDYLERAVRINPKLVGAWANLMNANKVLAKQSVGAEAKKYLEKAALCSKRLDELGFVNPKDIPPPFSNRSPI